MLVFCDDDSDVFNSVHEWWNSDGKKFSTPREALFGQLGFDPASRGIPTNAQTSAETGWPFGNGRVIWLRKNPVPLAGSAEGADQVVAVVQQAAKSAKLNWRETNSLLLRRGPYVIAAGLDESVAGDPKILHGHFVNLFDPDLRVLVNVRIAPGSRYFLRDLDATRGRNPQLLASACKALPVTQQDNPLSFLVEGVAQTPAVMLFHTSQTPRSATLDGQAIESFDFSKADGLLRIHFTNESRPRTLSLLF